MAAVTNTDSSSDQPAGAPLLRIVNADATADEVAALVAVFAALGNGASNGAPRRTPEWSQPARRLRGPVAHGPGGWRASSLPR